MPCNLAVSITKAQIVPDQLRELLTNEIIEQAMTTYLAGSHPDLKVVQTNSTPTLLTMKLSDTERTVDIIYYRASASLTVKVRGRGYTSIADDRLAQQLTDELTQLLTRAGDVVFASRVQVALMGLGGQMTTEQVVVDDAGAQRQAHVFTVTL